MTYYLAQANPFSALNIDPVGIVAQISNILYVIFILILFGGIFLIVWKKKLFMKFPTTAMIFRMRGEKMFLVDEDQARRVKHRKDGEIYYEFKKRPGLKWKPPSFEFLSPTTKGGRSVMFLKELGQDDFEIIDPMSFMSTSPSEYKRVESEELDKYYKNIQDQAARIKWNIENPWDKLLKNIAPVLIVFSMALFFYIVGQYVIIPTMDRFGGISGQAMILNNQSATLLDKSTSYIEILLRQQGGQSNTILYVCPNGRTVASPNLCFTGNSTP